MSLFSFRLCFFFFNDTATTEIYTLSLHDALPISCVGCHAMTTVTNAGHSREGWVTVLHMMVNVGAPRSEEHTSELQSHLNLVCRLLLEKKKTIQSNTRTLPTSS